MTGIGPCRVKYTVEIGGRHGLLGIRQVVGLELPQMIDFF